MRKLIIFSLILLSGCGEAIQNRAELAIREHEEFTNTEEIISERSEKLVNHILQIEDINKATATIIGDSAIIGIGTTHDLDDEKFARLRAVVEKDVKLLEPSLTHVAVTAAVEFVERLNAPLGSSADSPPKNDTDIEHVIESLTPPV